MYIGILFSINHLIKTEFLEHVLLVQKYNFIKQIMYQKIYYALLFLIFTFPPCTSQNLIQYKQIDSLKLYLELFSPENMNPGVKYPAMVFFHGGGWINGDRSQFAHQADYFSKRGIVCFLADYRLMDKTEKSPLVCLMDAKSSIRYIRHNAERFGIDPAKLIASGGSAGGHLAAATALIDNYNEITDDVSISCRPDVLVLFNPVIDNGPGGFGYSFVKNEFQFFSPLHNIKKSALSNYFFPGYK